ncbi:hypothetical protein [Oceanidesulfovibrio marinus]|uniref:Uncharacterized protein n=1 Tax=Oceanidesulfovibrio marinus TaxID=370038 RepID=A0A6P1ZJ27_9BACT|nr:hypothetical protein [Oceanidesulfovibrio marinus]QJT08090.1 hypothetical protein E8L03_03745 [Oceanidesulfovibrio marinus]TVM34991.1 hypothetical protein DQK91_06165 [Oceanidesulfovibrio marinus]
MAVIDPSLPHVRKAVSYVDEKLKGAGVDASDRETLRRVCEEAAVLYSLGPQESVFLEEFFSKKD